GEGEPRRRARVERLRALPVEQRPPLLAASLARWGRPGAGTVPGAAGSGRPPGLPDRAEVVAAAAPFGLAGSGAPRKRSSPRSLRHSGYRSGGDWERWPELTLPLAAALPHRMGRPTAGVGLPWGWPRLTSPT